MFGNTCHCTLLCGWQRVPRICCRFRFRNRIQRWSWSSDPCPMPTCSHLTNFVQRRFFNGAPHTKQKKKNKNYRKEKQILTPHLIDCQPGLAILFQRVLPAESVSLTRGECLGWRTLVLGRVYGFPGGRRTSIMAGTSPDKCLVCHWVQWLDLMLMELALN